MASRAGLARTKNITYDDRDVKNLEYNGYDWVLNGTWNAINVGRSGTLSSSRDPNATVTFNFPEPAVAFQYYGIPRSHGGLYGICIDCDPDNQHFQTIDGLNFSDDGKNPPIALFSKVFDTPAKHVVILRNQNDTRVQPRGNSQITVDRFVLEVIDDSPVPVTPSPPPFPVSDLVKPGPPIGAVIGGALGGGLMLAVVSTVIRVYWRRRRKHSNRIISTHDDINTNPSGPSLLTVFPYSQMHASITKEERPKTGSLRPPQPPQPSQSSPRTTSATTSSSTIAAYFHFRRLERRREVDAGPVHLEEDSPPLYEQVLEAGASNLPLPSGQVPHGHEPRPTAPDTAIMQSTAK
ncbi:hypothetical protein PQX77_020254 [Marasmius sp. AFHP31]|nr:hypothetical protein PQX77_020254 [Marasmius sp. AFHP31]